MIDMGNPQNLLGLMAIGDAFSGLSEAGGGPVAEQRAVPIMLQMAMQKQQQEQKAEQERKANEAYFSALGITPGPAQTVPTAGPGGYAGPVETKPLAAPREWDFDTANVNPDALNALGSLFDAYGSPLPVNSGYRSPEDNAKVGGAKHSQHMHGNAFDIDTTGMGDAERAELMRKADVAGFTGFGVYPNSMHFDTGDRRIWGPSYSRDSAPAWATDVFGALPSPTAQTAPSAPPPQPSAEPRFPPEILNLARAEIKAGNAAGARKILSDYTIKKATQTANGPRIIEGADGYKYTEQPDGSWKRTLPDITTGGGKPSATQEKIDLLTSTGVPRDRAIGIATGRFVTSRDPVSGHVSLMDKATGQVEPATREEVQVAADVQAEAAQPGEPDIRPQVQIEGADYTGATGGTGLFANVVNTITDAIGAGLMFPESEKAATALKNLSIRTETTLQDAVPGRPSNYLLERLSKLAVEPGSLLTGDARALDRLTQTKALIDGAIHENRQIIANSGNYRPVTVDAARTKLYAMRQLSTDYKAIIEQFEAKAKPQNFEAVTDEDRALFEKYGLD